MSRGAGVSDTKVLNRWVIVAAGIVIQLCLGTLYAFSVFRNPLIEQFGWTITETSLAFTICLVFFTITMVFAGFWQDKVGPRLVGSVGGILLGLGCLLASQTNSLMTLYLAYGVIAGSGVGLLRNTYRHHCKVVSISGFNDRCCRFGSVPGHWYSPLADGSLPTTEY